MNRRAMAKYAALAIAYANTGKMDNAGHFAKLWINQLGVTPHNLQNATAPDKYKGWAWNEETDEFQPTEIEGTVTSERVTLIRNGQKIG